jgi:hypothetical protein
VSVVGIAKSKPGSYEEAVAWSRRAIEANRNYLFILIFGWPPHSRISIASTRRAPPLRRVSPVSPLRQRMIDMTARRFKEKVERDYVRHVRTFAAFLGRSPDTATSGDLRRFQLHMAQQQISPGSTNDAIAPLRFFFNVTLQRPDLVRPLTIVNEPLRAPEAEDYYDRRLAERAAAKAKEKRAHRAPRPVVSQRIYAGSMLRGL